MARLTARLGVGRYEADEHYRAALALYARENLPVNALKEAIQHMTDALALVPQQPEYLAVRGFFHHELGQLDDAERDIDAALRANPYEVLANYCKGVLHYQRHEWPEARQAFMNAWAADTQRAETPYYLGLVFYRLGDLPNARRWMQGAVELLSQLNDKGRLEDARAWLRTFSAGG